MVCIPLLISRKKLDERHPFNRLCTSASCDPDSTTISYLPASAGRKLIMAATVPGFPAFNENSSVDDALNVTAVSPTDYYNYLNYPEDFGRCVYQRHGASILPPLYTTFFLVGLLGNSLVIWVIACGVRLRSMTDICLFNLAIADLLLVCSLPFLAHQARDQWVFGDAMCRVILGLHHIAFYSGIFFVSLMSIDRYLAIVHAIYAMRARTRSSGKIAVAVVWVVGVLASFPDLIFLKQQAGPNLSQYCYPVHPTDGSSDSSLSNPHFWRVFNLFKMNTLGLFVPAVIMVFCYTKIVRSLMNSQTSKKQAIRLVSVVVAIFFCCWVPYNVALFFKALEFMQIYTECESSKAIRLTLEVTEAIAYSHSCLNPFLYVFVGEKFRKNLIKLMNRSPCRLCRWIMVCMPQEILAGSVYSQTSITDERSTAV